MVGNTEKEYIDLCLSVKLVDCNEGANTPEECGDLLTYERAIKLVGDKLYKITKRDDIKN